MKAMIDLLPKLLQEMGYTRIVIDGVDERTARDQHELLKHLEKLISTLDSLYLQDSGFQLRYLGSLEKPLQEKQDDSIFSSQQYS